MKTFLITGGAGYIGSHTVLELLKSDYQVLVVDNLLNSSEIAIKRVEELSNKKVKFFNFDLREIDKLDSLFKEFSIDVVIHFAGLKAVGESVQKPLDYYDNNLISTLNLLKVMKENSVNKFVFSSSATVYNDPNYVEYFEELTTVTRASSPYGTTKVMQEWILSDSVNGDDFDSVDGLKVFALRYFNPIGADDSGKIGEDPLGIPNNLAPFITQVLAKRREFLNVWGGDYETKDGTCLRDYIHVQDLAKGHLLAAEKLFEVNGKYFEAVNLGSGNPVSVLEVINSFEKAAGTKIPFKIAERRAGDLPEFFANAKKAKELLGFETSKGLDSMTATSWNFQKNNPDGYNSKDS